jgi:hypothetical protein
MIYQLLTWQFISSHWYIHSRFDLKQFLNVIVYIKQKSVHWLNKATSASFVLTLVWGQLNNGKWSACFARTVCLRTCRVFQNHKSVWITLIGSFDLEKVGREMTKFTRCPFAKTTANAFRRFHLISSVNRPQRPFMFSTNQSSFLYRNCII